MQEIRVAFMSASNRISGRLLLPGDRGPYPCVIACHSLLTSQATPIIRRMAEHLCAGGMAVLTFDFYGTGESGGPFREKRLQGMARNLTDAIAFLQGQYRIDSNRLGLWGRTSGGVVSLLAAERSGVRATVAVNALIEENLAERMLERHADEDIIPLSQNDHEWHIHLEGMSISRSYFEEVRAFFSSNAFQEKLMRLSHVLHILPAGHPAADESRLDQLFQLIGEPKRWLVIPATDHNFTGKEDVLMAETTAWFQAYL